MQNRLSEIQITPIKAIDGLVGFVSFIFDNNFYLGGIGIYTRPTGGYRLTYPTRKGLHGTLNIFHPINKTIAECLEQEVTKKLNQIISK